MKFSAALLAFANFAGASSAQAASANSKFGAIINNSCTLISVADGILTQDISGMTLSSLNSGGSASQFMAVTTRNGYNITVEDPVTWTSEPGGNNIINFTASYSATGATILAETASSISSKLNSGSNNIHLNLTATGIDKLANGSYSAEVTVRCE